MRLLLFGLTAALVLSACPGKARHEATPSPLATKPEPGCDGLASVLVQLTRAEDPAAFAAERGLAWVDGSVRVVFESDGPLPEGVEEARSPGRVQALVPLDRLCALAAVAPVRVPLTPTPPPESSP